MFLVCSSRSRAKANKENNKEALVKFHYKGMGVVRDMLDGVLLDVLAALF